MAGAEGSGSFPASPAPRIRGDGNEAPKSLFNPSQISRTSGGGDRINPSFPFPRVPLRPPSPCCDIAVTSHIPVSPGATSTPSAHLPTPPLGAPGVSGTIHGQTPAPLSPLGPPWMCPPFSQRMLPTESSPGPAFPGAETPQKKRGGAARGGSPAGGAASPRPPRDHSGLEIAGLARRWQLGRVGGQTPACLLPLRWACY